MKIAIVHDYLNQMGGAERVLEVLHDLLGRPPVFTSVHDSARMPERFRDWDIRTSFLQRLPAARRHPGYYLPLFPTSFELFDFSGFDLVVSISSAWAKSVVTGPETFHLSMVLTPMRFAWSFDRSVRTSVARPLRAVLPFCLTWLRAWDAASASRPDRLIAISRTVADRVKKFWGRDAQVLHPPVDTSNFRPEGAPGEHYLVVSRLRDYKRIDLAVQAFTRAGLPLRVVGDGEDRRRLERMAGPTVEFVGRVGEEDLVREYRSCRALVLPGEEDFGLAPLEAQACGRPVLAYAAGGALETVIPEGPSDTPTGCFFREPTVGSLLEGLARIGRTRFDPERIRAHALEFDVARFRERFRSLLDRSLLERRAGLGVGS
ncbi:MAG: glycosyltransferase [Planctomycetes bacterium]|nr:glycosyltransferase [Planctomycetota bacterium]